jgi:3-hydroxybutyryl-CoA dehydrogenase
LQERLGIAGSGAIACGLAATAARNGQVTLWARSDESADRARSTVEKICSRLKDEDTNPEQVEVVLELDALGQATFIIEAVVEHHGSKVALLSELARHASDDAVMATTTSSLPIAELAAASGRPDRFVGFHPFNPVARMKLVELVFPEEATDATRKRARALCEALGKTAVEVPDIPGFVVNRLLFPYLFSAVELMSDTDLSAEDIDQCMALGAGMPMGPIALLDFIGLDVAQAIGQAIGAHIPSQLRQLVRDDALGRKSGRGFYSYDGG